MKLLYGTGNPAKLSDAREWLSGLSLEILSLNDMTAEIPEVTEDGNTPLSALHHGGGAGHGQVGD